MIHEKLEDGFCRKSETFEECFLPLNPNAFKSVNELNAAEEWDNKCQASRISGYKKIKIWEDALISDGVKIIMPFNGYVNRHIEGIRELETVRTIDTFGYSVIPYDWELALQLGDLVVVGNYKKYGVYKITKIQKNDIFLFFSIPEFKKLDINVEYLSTQTDFFKENTINQKFVK